MESQDWDFVGRIDFKLSTDSQITQADGLENNLIHQNDLRCYYIAIPQTDIEIFAPIANGISANIWCFYTILGMEIVMGHQKLFILIFTSDVFGDLYSSFVIHLPIQIQIARLSRGFDFKKLAVKGQNHNVRRRKSQHLEQSTNFFHSRLIKYPKFHFRPSWLIHSVQHLLPSAKH